MLKSLNNNQKFSLFVLGFSIITTTAVATFGSQFTAIISTLSLCILVILLRPMLMPPGYGLNKIRMFSLVGAFAIATTWGQWGGFLDNLIKLTTDAPEAQNIARIIKALTINNEPSVSVLIFVLLSILIVNYFTVSKSIDTDHPVPIDDIFPEENIHKQLEAFCSILDRHLIQIDIESNWSPEYYTEIQAEVEILSSHGKIVKKKILNLQQAIRSDKKSRTFLILGTPGAGKSVALRKLAMDMLKEFNSKKRIPIYINLRELNTDGNTHPLTMDRLEKFIINNIIERGDLHTKKFINEYFLKLWQYGFLFFIFDSFDEMPELLDADENSKIIGDLSVLLSRFISSSPNSRGLLASRVYRKPTQAFLTQKILEIRPLSEPSIIKALNRFPHLSEELKSELFNRRIDLIPIARNPFLMTLLGEWVSHKHSLPQTQSQIYEFYLRKRLEECETEANENGLTIDQILSIAKKIAWFVFTSPSLGLEAPVSVLNKGIDSDKIESVIEILSYARIARTTRGSNKSFAFVHRRFLEYFVTKTLLENPDNAPIEHIPSDSRGRDALVLYAQLCAEPEAERLVQICWTEIVENFELPTTRLRAIHCLRFITEAFYSRRESASKIIKPLQNFITVHTRVGNDMILAKICLEGTGLIPESDAVPILCDAINGNDPWLQETAFRACRNLPRLEPTLENGLSNYIQTIDTISFWKSRTPLLLSLSLSDSMSNVLNTAKLRILNIQSTLVALLALAFISPTILMSSVVMTGFAWLFFLSFESTIKKASASNYRLFGTKTTEEALLNFFRYILSIMLGFQILMHHTGFLSFLKNNIESKPEKLTIQLPDIFMRLMGTLDTNIPYFWGLFELPSIVTALLLAVLAAAIIDWLLTYSLVKNIYRIKLNKETLTEATAVTAGAILIFTLMYFILDYLSTIAIFNKIMSYFIPAVFLLFSLYLLLTLMRTMILQHKDRKIVHSNQIHGTVLRKEIVDTFSKLNTRRGKLMYLKKLEQNRTQAIGEWPEKFKLSVGSDEAISALARLEEKWLKLD